MDGVAQTPPLTDFSTYNIGSFADIRLVSPPVTLDDAGMNCAWMATDPLFSSAFINGAYEFKGATMVLAEDLLIDGCTLILEGSKLIFREDAVNNPTLTIGNGGVLIMKTDTGTGDLPKIYGESNLDAVDIELQAGALLDMQSGTMKNFLLSSSKTGQLVVPSGAEVASEAVIIDLSSSTTPSMIGVMVSFDHYDATWAGQNFKSSRIPRRRTLVMADRTRYGTNNQASMT